MKQLSNKLFQDSTRTIVMHSRHALKTLNLVVVHGIKLKNTFLQVKLKILRPQCGRLPGVFWCAIFWTLTMVLL